MAKSAGQQGEGPAEKDQQAEKDRNEIQRIISTGGPGVKDAGKMAFGGAPAYVRKSLEVGQLEARDEGNQVLVPQIIGSGGAE
ncbi:ALF repeat-containing protein [Streptomyces roseoverticillatus]|uniref:ALF repeat-containing protein n=1 Tax=Streptomyces roseoverticillatus TaxID=66429 RepID=UPI000B017147|nr:ALF repeat-containing protein [Streptomyces roseoverticillatus]